MTQPTPAGRRPTRAFLVGLACLGLAPACGPADGRPPLFAALGKVTYQGKPLSGASILLRKATPEDAVLNPFATTGEDGSFALTTFETGDGAPEGEYLVAIETRARKGEAGLAAVGARPVVDVLKGKYADPRTSGLKATIKPGAAEIGPFDLR